MLPRRSGPPPPDTSRESVKHAVSVHGHVDDIKVTLWPVSRFNYLSIRVSNRFGLFFGFYENITRTKSKLANWSANKCKSKQGKVKKIKERAGTTNWRNRRKKKTGSWQERCFSTCVWQNWQMGQDADLEKETFSHRPPRDESSWSALWERTGGTLVASWRHNCKRC